MKLKIVVSIILFIIIIFGISKFIPKEEELPTSPIISSYEGIKYATTKVEIGDIFLTKTITFKYQASSVDELEFVLDGYSISNVYVQEGDSVEKGDLLAELYIDDLKKELDICENSLTKFNLQLSQIEQKYNVEYQKQVDYRETLSEEQLSYTATPEEVVINYISQIDEIKDKIWIQNLRIKELEKSIAERQIYASMDGIISYVKPIDEKSISIKNTTYFEIMDSETSIFTAATTYENMLEIGQKIEIEINDILYDATVILPEGYSTYDEVNDEYYYYIELDMKNVSLADGDKGVAKVILEESLNVLCLPEEAVSQSKGKDVVYYLNEEGYRDVKYIELGLCANGYVEIISGLSENESVICGLE